MSDSPIILNEREARRTRATLARIDEVLSPESVLESAKFGLAPEVAAMHRKAVVSSRNTLSAMLNTYERIRSGEYGDVASKWEAEPGIVLIVARLARALSQAELGEKLGMREQQIQRYESERYRSISLQNFRRVAVALGVQLKASISSQIAAQLSQLALPEQIPMSPKDQRLIADHARKYEWFSMPSDDEEQRRVITDYISDSHGRFGSPALLRTGLKSIDLKDDVLLAAWRARVMACAERVTDQQKNAFDHFDISWLPKLVQLSRYDDGPKRAISFAAERGVIVVIEPQLTGLRLDGAAFLSGGTPIIGLTLRHDRIDNFWFTLLHECAHVFLHYHSGLAAGFFDEDLEQDKADDMEKEADQFASSMLIAAELWRTSPVRIAKSPTAIEEFSRRAKINPAIVFGRIRKERNDYKLFSDRVGHGKVRGFFFKD
jgi:HTH-type transcriptional regulator/antitoxin HigA